MNMLLLRIILVLASMWFTIHAIVVGKIFVDMLVFNVVFMIINGVYSYFLFLKYLPIKLTPIEQRIFEKDFSKVMSKADFRDFIKKGYLRSVSAGGQICHLNNNFSGLYYIALINPNYKVNYIKNNKKFTSVNENSWIGVVEYMMFKKERLLQDVKNKKENQLQNKKPSWKKLKSKVKWGLSAVVEEIPEEEKQFIKPEAKQDPFYEDDDDPCFIYEFPLEELEKLFNDKDTGITWKNALFAIWLGYTTKTILSVDRMVVTTKKKIELKSKESRIEMISRPSGALVNIEMPKMEVLDLDLKKSDPNNQYDTEGRDHLLSSDRDNLIPNQIQLDVYPGK